MLKEPIRFEEIIIFIIFFSINGHFSCALIGQKKVNIHPYMHLLAFARRRRTFLSALFLNLFR